jgi:hypothetical protein
MTGSKISRRSAVVALAAAPIVPTFANRISPARTLRAFDLVVGESRQASVEAPDVAAALALAAGYKQGGDDVAVWLDNRLVGVVTDSGAIELGRLGPPSPPPGPRTVPPLSTPSPAALAALRDYVALWRSYVPNAFDDTWYEAQGGRAHCDRMHAAEELALRLSLGGDPRVPLEKIRHDLRAFAVDDALVVVATGWSDRDRPIGSMGKCFEGHFLLIVEPPAANA